MTLTRRTFLQASAATVAAAALAPPTVGAAVPSIVIESQDWWAPIPGLADRVTQGHLHLAITLPTGPVSGVIDVPMLVTSHDNLAHLNLLKFQTDDWGQTVHKMNFDLANDQPFAHLMPIDTRKLKDGWRLFRFYAQAQHSDGAIQVARPILPVEVRNGNTVKNASGSDRWKPTAWYKDDVDPKDWGYVLSALDRADLPISGPVPAGWAPFVQFAVNDKGGSPPISRHEVRIDPRFHDGIPGIIVKQGGGAFKGRVPIPVGSLAPGAHKLVLLSHQELGDRHHTGVAVYPFTV